MRQSWQRVKKHVTKQMQPRFIIRSLLTLKTLTLLTKNLNRPPPFIYLTTFFIRENKHLECNFCSIYFEVTCIIRVGRRVP